MQVNGEFRLLHTLTEWLFDFLPQALSVSQLTTSVAIGCVWHEIGSHAQDIPRRGESRSGCVWHEIAGQTPRATGSASAFLDTQQSHREPS